MGVDVLVEPQREVGVAAVDGVGRGGVVGGLGELRDDAVVFGLRRVERERLELRPFGLDLAGELGSAPSSWTRILIRAL